MMNLKADTKKETKTGEFFKPGDLVTKLSLEKGGDKSTLFGDLLAMVCNVAIELDSKSNMTAEEILDELYEDVKDELIDTMKEEYLESMRETKNSKLN